MFVIAAVFLFLPYLLLFVLLVAHYCFWKSKYNTPIASEKKSAEKSVFDLDWVIPNNQKIGNDKLIEVLGIENPRI